MKNVFLLHLFILLTQAGTIIAQNAPELLRNGNMVVAGKDINGLPDGWEPKYCEGAETTAAFKTVALDSRKVAELTWVDGSANFGIQPADKVKFEPGKAYEFSAMGKTDGDGKLQLAVEVYGNANLGKLLLSESTEEFSTAEWKKISVCFEVPAGAMDVKLYCFNRGQGQVWYTDVSLIPVPSERIASVFPIKFGCEPAEGNAIWNGGKSVFNTFGDSPCSMSFDFWGDVKKLKNPAFVIDLPAGIELAECIYPNPGINAIKVSRQQSEIERDGQKYTRYAFENAKCFQSIKPAPAWMRTLTVLLKPCGKTIPDKMFKVYCFIQNSHDKSPERVFYINVLPPMQKTPNPKIFQAAMLWKNYDISVSDPELFKAIISRFEEANMTCRTVSGNSQDKVCRERGWKMAYFYGDNIIFQPILKKYGNKYAALRYDGKQYPGNHTCPSFQLSPEVVNACREEFTGDAVKVGLRNGDTVVLDYEPWNASEWCYCMECLKRFTAFAGLKAIPAPDEIRKNMIDKWADFRVKDSADILRAHAEIARTAGSEIKVTDYDYPLSFGNLGGRFRTIPKDSRLSDEFVDDHFNSYYHTIGKSAFDMISLNAATLKKPLVYVPLLSRYTDPEQREFTNLKQTLSPDQFKTAMVSSAASGAKGLSIWDGLKIDGKFFVAIDHGMAEIAALEDYFYSGTRNDKIASATPVDTGNAKLLTDSLGVRVHEYQEKTLVSLFNFSISKPLSFKLKTDLPDGKYQMSDPFVKNAATEFKPAQSIDITLPPNGSKFIILKKAE